MSNLGFRNMWPYFPSHHKPTYKMRSKSCESITLFDTNSKLQTLSQLLVRVFDNKRNAQVGEELRSFTILKTKAFYMWIHKLFLGEITTIKLIQMLWR